jgi:hypothetical protein
MHVPSQPLTRPPLSRFQTSADFSQSRRFFRVWRMSRVASLTGRSAYFKWATCDSSPLFSAVDCEPTMLAILQPSTPARECAGVDALAVAALDAITAFAVPNLGGSSRNAVDFFGSGGSASHLAHPSLSLLQVGDRCGSPLFSAINRGNPTPGGGNVNAQGLCNPPFFCCV